MASSCRKIKLNILVYMKKNKLEYLMATTLFLYVSPFIENSNNRKTYYYNQLININNK